MQSVLRQSSLPLVTIAIPTYNRAATYLADTIRSALVQTYPRIEVLVSDNASTDQTRVLLAGMKDRRLRYRRHQTNIGANRNFNYCLDHAAGEYFLLLHDDDLIDPDFVEACISASHDGDDAGLIRTGIRVIDEHGRVMRESRNSVAGMTTGEFFLAWFHGRTSWYLANTLFHTERLRQTGGFHSPHSLAEDGFAIARLAARYPRFDVEAVKSSFRVHCNSQTYIAAPRAAQWGEDYLCLLNLMCELAPAEMRQVLWGQGLRFFARLTYSRASRICQPFPRLGAYIDVFRSFHCRYLPDRHFYGRGLALRVVDSIRRRAQRVWDRPTAHNPLRE